MLTFDTDRFIFQNMVEMIHDQGQVDIQQIRQRLPEFAPGQTKFTTGNVANFDLVLTFTPTPDQVERAIEILNMTPMDWDKWREWRRSLKS
jgi:hypothetical protein